MSFSILAGGKGKYIFPSFVQASGIFPRNLFRWFFLWHLVTSTGKHSVEFSRGTLCSFPELSVFAALVCLVPCPENSSYFSLPYSKLCPLSTRGNQPSSARRPLSCTTARKFLSVSWGRHPAHFFFSHLLRITALCCLRSMVLRIVVSYILFGFSVVSSVGTIFLHNTSDTNMWVFFFHTNNQSSNSRITNWVSHSSVQF